MSDFYFTPRQKDILQAVANGHTRRDEIADVIGIAPGTVHQHLNLMYKAAGVNSIAKLLAVAIRRGWVTMDRPTVKVRER